MTGIDIVNDALGSIGAVPIQSFDEPGPGGTTPQDTYNSVLEDLLSRYTWKFATKYKQLTQISAAAGLGWTYKFTLPPDREGPPRGYYDGGSTSKPLTSFELVGNVVYANVSELWAQYPYEPPLSHWPGYFKALTKRYCMSEFALSVREDKGLHSTLRNECFGPPSMNGEGGLMGEAMAADSQANPSPQADGGRNPIGDARYSGEYAAGDARIGW